MKTYRGFRDDKYRLCSVLVIDGAHISPLAPRLDLHNHSPTGFEWGYGGSGPAQLALALLADALGNDERAWRLHQEFKRQVIATLARDGEWQFEQDEIVEMAEALMSEQQE